MNVTIHFNNEQSIATSVNRSISSITKQCVEAMETGHVLVLGTLPTLVNTRNITFIEIDGE